MSEITFSLPDLGEGLQEAHIAEWHCREGDAIELNQRLLEVETQKTAVEIPSPHSGRIVRLHRREGDTVRVGEPLVTIEVGSDNVPNIGIVGRPRTSVSPNPARRVRLKPRAEDARS